MRLIDADALKEKAFGKRGGLIHTADIDAMPTIEPESGCIEQIKWERDMAIQQLEELGYGLGGKPREPEREAQANALDTDAKDMISRQAAIDALSHCQIYLFDSRDKDKKISLEDAEYASEQLSSAQPERKKGKWIEHNNGQWLCSICGQRCMEIVMMEPRWKYCPNCGAMMKSEGE